MLAYRELPDIDLFLVQEVTVNIRPQDLPGRPLGKEICDSCGETVLDLREVRINGATLCRPCAQGAAYYSICAEPRVPKEEEVYEQPV
jgi:formylmethanofuran dehydrogenase subunit E